ncbi:MAG: hypothetical protein GY765_22555 [bacterium]|nr:hypothetical protein [bacterium]
MGSRQGKPKQVITSWAKRYQGFEVSDGNIYTVLKDFSQKAPGESANKESRKFTNHVIKVDSEGNISETIVYGFYGYLGRCKDTIYLFQSQEYYVLPVKMSELKLLKK